MTNTGNDVLYTGVTNDIRRRVIEHISGNNKKSFTYKYRCFKLVYYEEYGDVNQAIAREKQIKGKRREYKRELIEAMNPMWSDLMADCP